jgi:hypothetical protein
MGAQLLTAEEGSYKYGKRKLEDFFNDGLVMDLFVEIDRGAYSVPYQDRE